ncbi:MAG: nucleotidyltransferase domain-containing protein [Chloroflexi bacterium]|nr:nucleotidyltransferase domain-containing protein [Chloroflexota bacterium]
MSPQIKRLLKELKTGLVRIYGEQLDSVYLYGSYARGDNKDGSDLDVLVVLNDFQRRAAELRRISQLIGDLSLDFEITVSPLFMRESEWKMNKFPLLRNVKKEGVAI